MDYLGMKVGGGGNRISSWEGVFDKINRRLGGWESKTLSMGGRLTLINSVLTAVPIYRMSLQLMPAGTVKKLRSIQRGFFWGKGEGEKKKMAWVGWDNICQSKRDGGLWIKNLKWFNLALVGKWMWRFLKESNNLWVRVVKSRMESFSNPGNCDRSLEVVKCESGWWKNVISAIDGSNGNWFLPKLKKDLGDGLDTRFWEENWAGETVFKSKFPRLYNLHSNKKIKVGEAGKWINGRWVWDWVWRRPLLERENRMVEEMKEAIEGIHLKQGVSDKWIWGDGNYSVRKAYEEIVKSQNISGERPKEAVNCRILWRTIAPLKQQIMAWRAMRNRLPTKDNLHRRIGLVAEERVCVCCGRCPETAQHLFLRCVEVERIWDRMMGWIGLEWSAPEGIGEHFLAFSRLLNGKNGRRSLEVFGFV